jgi:hypothetical protein
MHSLGSEDVCRSPSSSGGVTEIDGTLRVGLNRMAGTWLKTPCVYPGMPVQGLWVGDWCCKEYES